MKQESSCTDGDIPLKLPRAMRSAMADKNPLRERNYDQHINTVVKKESGTQPPTSPYEQANAADEKENQENKS